MFQLLLALTRDEIRETLTDLAAVATAVAVIIGILKFPYTRLSKWINRVKIKQAKEDQAIFQVIPELKKNQDFIMEKIAFIFQELHPNHGDSLRDVINRIERQGQKTEAMFLAWLSQDARAICFTDETGNLLWTNHSYLELVNKDSMEVMGRGYWQTVDPAQVEEVKETITLMAKDRRGGTFYFNIMTGDPDFPIIPIEMVSTPIFNEKDLVGYISTLRRLDDH